MLIEHSYARHLYNSIEVRLFVTGINIYICDQTYFKYHMMWIICQHNVLPLPSLLGVCGGGGGGGGFPKKSLLVGLRGQLIYLVMILFWGALLWYCIFSSARSSMNGSVTGGSGGDCKNWLLQKLTYMDKWPRVSQTYMYWS